VRSRLRVHGTRDADPPRLRPAKSARRENRVRDEDVTRRLEARMPQRRSGTARGPSASHADATGREPAAESDSGARESDGTHDDGERRPPSAPTPLRIVDHPEVYAGGVLH
jgi:hypothetical protein